MNDRGAPPLPDHAGSDVRSVLANPRDASIFSLADSLNGVTQKEYGDV